MIDFKSIQDGYHSKSKIKTLPRKQIHIPKSNPFIHTIQQFKETKQKQPLGSVTQLHQKLSANAGTNLELHENRIYNLIFSIHTEDFKVNRSKNLANE